MLASFARHRRLAEEGVSTRPTTDVAAPSDSFECILPLAVHLGFQEAQVHRVEGPAELSRGGAGAQDDGVDLAPDERLLRHSLEPVPVRTALVGRVRMEKSTLAKRAFPDHCTTQRIQAGVLGF